MSLLEKNKLNTSLIWGTLRNLIDFSEIDIQEPFSLVGIEQGTFPVDTYHPIYLEVPRSIKSDISGRSSINSPSKSNINIWKNRRIISLPIYREKRNLKNETVQDIFRVWNDSFVPKEIPSIAIATSILGGYSTEGRIAQYSAILILWANQTARILELEWFEGPLEDCVTPEWYIRTSELMTANNAIKRMREFHKISPAWDKPRYSIFSIPSNIGMNLLVDKSSTNYGIWGYGREYYEFHNLQNDLEKTLGKLKEFTDRS